MRVSTLKPFAILALALTLGACEIRPVGYYAYSPPPPPVAPAYAPVQYTPVPAQYAPYAYYTEYNCPYYYDTWRGPICVRPHPQYGYVYTGGPGVVVGGIVPWGIHADIRFGRGGWRGWGWGHHR